MKCGRCSGEDVYLMPRKYTDKGRRRPRKGICYSCGYMRVLYRFIVEIDAIKESEQ